MVRTELLRFRQESEHGVLHCEVSVAVGRCTSCSSAHVDEEADAAIRAEVERARAELAGRVSYSPAC